MGPGLVAAASSDHTATMARAEGSGSIVEPGVHHFGDPAVTSAAEMIENLQLIRRGILGRDRPEQMRCSQAFFDTLASEQHEKLDELGLPVRVDEMLMGMTAVILFASGRILYLTDKSDKDRSPEQQADDLRIFLTTPPPAEFKGLDHFFGRMESSINDVFGPRTLNFPKNVLQSSDDGGIGFCPKCGAPGVMRERQPNGNDTCKNGHTYPSSQAVNNPSRPKK